MRRPGAVVTGLTFSILALFIGWIPLYGWAIVLFGILFSIIGFRICVTTANPGRRMALAGIILGLVALIPVALILRWVI